MFDLVPYNLPDFVRTVSKAVLPGMVFRGEGEHGIHVAPREEIM